MAVRLSGSLSSSGSRLGSRSTRSQGVGSRGIGSKGGLKGIGLGALHPLLLIVVLLLVAVGLITVYAVTLTNANYSFLRQVIGVGIGVVIMIAIWLLDYRIFEQLTIPLFIAALVLILLPRVPGLGMEVNGATSWVKIGPISFQPSEFAKPVIILLMASYVSRFNGTITEPRDYIKGLFLTLIPVALLSTEDLGSSLVILVIGFVILFIGGTKGRFIVITLMVFALGIAGLFMLNTILYEWSDGEVKIIPEYRLSRLLVFMDPDNPSYSDDAYNLKQAQIAVGSGEVVGKGWGNASQSTGGFLPESATDFIFCAFAEQFGFIGCIILLCLYLALLLVALSIGLKSSDLNGALIVAGILAMWIFQILENIGMDLGLMPITGIPLPFMSYGSSFMMINFICIGLLLSVWARRGSGSRMSRRIGE